jgi:pyruvate formate lyase activating enzyme
LRYVYTGNVRDATGMQTCCPHCGALLIERDWHFARVIGMEGARCKACHATVPGRFA